MVKQYPFGPSTLSAEDLPLPPPSSFTRKTIHVRLVTLPTSHTNIPRKPDGILTALLRRTVYDSARFPLWHGALSGANRENATQEITSLLGDQSLLFITSINSEEKAQRPSSKPEDLSPSWSIVSRPDSETAESKPAPSPQYRRRSRSFEPTSGRTFAVYEKSPGAPRDGTARYDSLPARSPPGFPRYASVTSLRASSFGTWADFEKAGFDEAEPIQDLHTTFDTGSKKSVATPMSSYNPRPGHVLDDSSSTDVRDAVADGQRFQIVQEESLDLDDGFLSCIESGQSDPKLAQQWLPFALVTLRDRSPEETMSAAPFEWVLVTIDEPQPDPSLLLAKRAMSPDALSQRSRMSSTFSLRNFSGPFRRSRSYPARSKRNQTLAAVATLAALKEDGPADHVGMDPRLSSKAPTSQVQKRQSLRRKPVADREVFDTEPSCWSYVAEGGAHIVFRYQGPRPLFGDKVLRIAKPASNHPNMGRSDVDRVWMTDLLQQVVPRRFLLASQFVDIPRDWYTKVILAEGHKRPTSRVEHDVVNREVLQGMLVEDVFAHDIAVAETLSVEIKVQWFDFSTSSKLTWQPKWALLPKEEYVRPAIAAAIKTRECRTCMLRLLRDPKSSDFEPAFCPLDLFSGDDTRMDTAIDGLIAIWSHSNGEASSLRVEHNGIDFSHVSDRDGKPKGTNPIVFTPA